MKLLLHVCCGPCATGAVPWWQARATEVVGFFFNPNIQPLLEYRRRLTGARDVADRTGVRLVVDDAYDPAAWFASVLSPEDSRCSRCIALRLERAAEEATEEGCDAFSTTLLISPWQNHEAIAEQGAMAAARHGVSFLYEDLRSLYPHSREQSREWGIYRQKYCGCVVSEWERYRDAPAGRRGSA